MSHSVSTLSVTHGTVSGANETGIVVSSFLYNSDTSYAETYSYLGTNSGIGLPPTGWSTGSPSSINYPPFNSWFSKTYTKTCDTQYYAKSGAWGNWAGANYISTGPDSFKTYAVEPTVGTPTLSGATSTTVTVNGSVTPGTTATSVTVEVQYKKTTDEDWTTWGTSVYTGASLTSQTMDEATITSLDSSTSYDFRFKLDRTNTTNATKIYYGSTASESTLAGEPTVTTDAATSITNDGATLNCTQDVNEGTTMTVYWKWGKQTPPTDFTTSTTVVTADGSTDLAVTGADASTKYYHQAYITFVTPDGTPNSGDILNFTTLADPAAEAANQSRCMEYEFYGKYGVASNFWICVPSIVSDDVFLTTASPFAAGDVKVSKDGGNYANITTLPSQVSAGKALYLLPLSATEMTANFIHVRITDAAGSIFRDVSVKISTRLQISEVDIDAATGTKANTSAVKLSGYGSGHGLECVKGATGNDIEANPLKHIMSSGTMQSGAAGATTAVLAATENTDDNYYNGAIILWHSGTGAGQARVITDHVNATDTITLNRALTSALSTDSEYVIIPGPDMWAISPAAEMSGTPIYSDDYADMLQAIFQRVVYKRTETATVHTMYKVDDTTSLATYGVDDDGATETKLRTEDA